MRKIMQICSIIMILPGVLWAGNESSMRADRSPTTGIYAYVADQCEGLCIIDVSDPINPIEVGFCNTTGYPRDVYVSENYAYVVDETGLRIIYISDPTNPTEVGFYDTPGDATGVYFSGIYAYVADGDSGLRIIDVSDPTNPFEVGYFDGFTCLDVYISGNYAYAGAGDWRLLIIDVSDPANPFEVGSFDTFPFFIEDCVVSGSYAYLGYWAFVKQEKLDSPFPLQELEFMPGRWDIFIILDISDPSNPFRVGACELPSIAMGVYLAGNYAYVAGWEHGLQIIDVSDPSNPYVAGSCNQTNDFLFGVWALGNYAYAADYSGNFRVYDVLDPTNPFEVSLCDSIWGAYAVHVVDYEPPQVTVISPNGGEGFEPGDICDITWLAEDNVDVDSISILYSIDAGMDWDTVATGETNDSTYSWTVPDTQSDSCLVRILAYDPSFNTDEDQSDSFFIISSLGIEENSSSPSFPGYLQIVPNPFRASTEITFSMGQSEEGNRITSGSMLPGSYLKIYDAGGRLIRQWDYPDADHSCHAVWNGRDDHGCEVSTGVYLIRFETQDHAVTEKVILLK